MELELKAWFGQGNFCALTFTGYARGAYSFDRFGDGEFADAHHIVPQELARNILKKNPHATLGYSGMPIKNALHSTINGLPLIRSIHNRIHQTASTDWEVPLLTQQVAQ